MFNLSNFVSTFNSSFRFEVNRPQGILYHPYYHTDRDIFYKTTLASWVLGSQTTLAFLGTGLLALGSWGRDTFGYLGIWVREYWSPPRVKSHFSLGYEVFAKW